MKRWLVTGGAGYIGSHVVHDLIKAGAEVIVFDDLSTGFDSYIPEGVRLVKANLNNTTELSGALKGTFGVIHLAAYKYASESVDHAIENHESNVIGTFNLLKCMKAEKVAHLIFSSSAGVYGSQKVLPVTEESACEPESPYATSKLIDEMLIKDVVNAHDPISPLHALALRYFNVVGSGYPHLADKSPYSLFSIILNKYAKGEKPSITGNDFPTPDGTPIRDYIHVSDISNAHVLAAQHMEANSVGYEVLNLSTANGISVLEVMNEFKKQLGDSFQFDFTDRRPGDPAASYGDATKAKKVLGWSAKESLQSMVASSIASTKQA